MDYEMKCCEQEEEIKDLKDKLKFYKRYSTTYWVSLEMWNIMVKAYKGNK